MNNNLPTQIKGATEWVEFTEPMLRLFPFAQSHPSNPIYSTLWTASQPFSSSQFPEDCPIYPPFQTVTSSSLPLLYSSLSLVDMVFHLHLGLLTHLCLPVYLRTVSVLVMAGLSQTFLVFNLSYVRQLGLRLDLLYQYQAIASEVPCDRYTTDSSTCEPLILRPIA